MATGDIISRLKGDNVLAQRIPCGKCGMPMAQSEDGISERNLVNVKNKKIAGEDKNARGLMCGTCLKNKRFVDEGPRNAIMLNETTDDIQPVYFDNLLDFKESTTEKAITDEDEEIERSTETGKVTHQKRSRRK